MQAHIGGSQFLCNVKAVRGLGPGGYVHVGQAKGIGKYGKCGWNGE